MKVEVRFRGIQPSRSLRDHALRRIRLHIGRFGPGVRSVVMRIGDVNGPKGGVDKHCRIMVRGPLLGASTLDELSADAYSAVDAAVARMARAMNRCIDRARSSGYGRPSVRVAS